jgi:hypothetical protein
MKLYLAGLMEESVLDKCIAWRKKIVDHYSNWKGSGKMYGDLCFLDPCNGEIKKDGFVPLPKKAIFDKDYICVRNCDLLIANLNTFGIKRWPIGTIMEVAWAKPFHKPVIMITSDLAVKEHPFPESIVSWYFKSVDDMLEKKAINHFYKAWHSARY